MMFYGRIQAQGWLAVAVHAPEPECKGLGSGGCLESTCLNDGLQVITEKLLDYLHSATDDSQKAEVAQRIGELAERFAPDTQWFIDTMNQVCRKTYSAPEGFW